ncbi:MAG: polysaccharide pyruvyl transferase family protein [Flavobacteriaceae bacterium]
MKIYYYEDPLGNFGDDLNQWLWERLLPGWRGGPEGTLLSVIGTLIGPAMPHAERWVVFSSGAGYGPPPPDFNGPRWNIVCVRGPLTAQVLDLPAETAVTDGAALLGALPELAPLASDAREGVVFMPHHKALPAGAWEMAAQRAGIGFIDPRGDSRESIERIRRSRLVIADAMHAAIVADTLRVPWVPVRTSPEINAFKWLDWSLSMSVPYEPVALPPSSVLEAVRSTTLPFYGNVHALAEPTAAAAREHYRRHRRMKTRAYWPLRRKLGHGAYTKLLRPLVTSYALSSWRRGEDERRIDGAAAALQAAAMRPGFLSDDNVLARRQDELLSRLYAFAVEHRVLPLAG